MIAIFTLCAYSAYNQNSYVIPKIQGEFSFDGVVDDACWQSLKPLEMIMHTPTFGNQPTEKSEVMICYDNTYVYVGARLFDSNPSDMLVSSKKRDEMDVLSESLMLIFDSFNDKENGLGFITTPTGLRTDFTISKDAIGMDIPFGENPLSTSWNTFWDVKTTRNDQGWFAEFRIPVSSMRFKENDGLIVMGLTCVRMLAHKNEVDVFPAIPPDWGMSSVFRPSKSQEVIFEGIKSSKPFYIAPYVFSGYQRNSIKDETGTAYETVNTPKLNAGLDLKYGLTNNLTLDLTINTDFAQVEADDEQINLTRFSLFFPEKRTFFQERSSSLKFDFEPGSSLFYSRQIGLNGGERVPILAGAKITGMAGKWDIGMLDLQTQSFDVADTSVGKLASENFGLLRLRRQVINESSYVGGIVTTRIGTDGSYNTAYGIDGIFKVAENDYLNVKLSQVIDNHFENNMVSLDPSKLYISWDRYTQKGVNYNFNWTRSGKDFDPKVGFQARNNYTLYYAGFGYGWIPGEESGIMNHGIRFSSMAYTDNISNSAQSVETELSYNLDFKSGFGGVFILKNIFENVIDTFSFSKDCEVPTGKYSFNQVETHLNSPMSNKFVMGVDLFAGTFYDGNRFSFKIKPSLNIGSSLQLGLQYEQNFLKFSSRNQSFSGGIAGFKALVMFTTKTSISTFIQYNTTENMVMTNFRFRYNPREGNDFYIVINEGRNTYRDIEDPRLPAFNNQNIILKYVYTFSL